MKKQLILSVLIGIAALFAVSLAANRVAVLETFDVNPNPMYRNTFVNLVVSEPCFVSLWIEDLEGNLVKQLHSGYVMKGLRLEWNRYADSGLYAPNGTYYVVANYQGRYTSTKKTLILK